MHRSVRLNLYQAALTLMNIDFNAIHKALSNTARRDFLRWLRAPHEHFRESKMPFHQGVCAGNFESASGLSQSTVSAHLSLMQQAGLVTAVKIGRWVLFKRDEVVIRAFIAQMDKGL
jgi:DNA-binding transcriptional ArsR family regulator